MQVLAAEAADKEMPVVDQRILHARCREVGGQLRLPHAFGEPQSRGLHPKATLEILAQATDLLEPVGPRQRGQDRLVEARQQHLEMPVGHVPADGVEPRRIVAFEPLEQRTGDVQGERKEPGSRGPLDEWPIHIAHVIRHHMIEVSHRLMQVEPKHKADGRGAVLHD